MTATHNGGVSVRTAERTTAHPQRPGRADRLSEALEQVSAALEASQPVDRDALLAEYADVADELAGCLDSLDFVHNIAPQLKDDQQFTENKQASSTIAPLATLGDFRILREIGRGGMGVVYEAQQLSLGRHVALKVLPFAAMLKEQQLKRFQNEARAAATLSHPNIVTVHAVGVDRGVHYYAMELIGGNSVAEAISELRVLRENGAGHTDADHAVATALTNASRFGSQGDLRSEISAGSGDPRRARRGGLGEGENVQATQPSPNTSLQGRGTLAADTVDHARAADSTSSFFSDDGHGGRSAHFRAVARIGIQAAEALDHAHQHGVVHRDVKPANLLLDGSGHLWVTDFGLARIESDPGITMTGDLFGTLRYMSPEQVLSKRVVIDHRTDVYSLGLTVYEILVLQPAFADSDRQELFRQITFQDPKPPRRLNRSIPVELETIVLKAARKNPDERYATAQELVDDLQRFLEDKPILAKPPSVADRLNKWTRRHRALVASAMLLLLTITIGSALSAGLIWQANNKTQNALTQSELNFQEAERQKRAVEQRAAENEAVVDFLVNDLLAAASPERARGRQITVKEVLANAEKKIVSAFDDQPLIEASVRQVLGDTYRALGDYQTAQDHLTLACETRRRQLGPDHPNTLTSIYSRACVLHVQGKFNESREQLEEVVRLQQRVLGADHPDTLRSLSELASVLSSQGETENAVKLQERVLEAQRRILGPDDRDTLRSLTEMAALLWHQGEYKKAEELCNQVLGTQQLALGASHPDTIDSVNIFALVLSRLGRHAEAQGRLEEGLETSRRVLGAEHPDTLTVLHNLAFQNLIRGKTDEAEEQFKEGFKTIRRLLGAEHPYTLNYMESLAGLLSAQDKFHEAEDLYNKVVDVRCRVRGSDHEDTLRAMVYLASALSSQDRYREAQGWLEEVVEVQRRKLGPEHPGTLSTRQRIASVEHKRGNSDAALEMLRVDVETSRRALGVNHKTTLRLATERAKILVELGRFNEAREDWEQLVARGKPTFELARYVQRYGDQAEKEGRNFEAKQAFAAAAVVYGRLPGPRGDKGLFLARMCSNRVMALSGDREDRDYVQVLQQMEQMARVQDSNPHSLLILGAAQHRTGEFLKAIGTINQSLASRFGRLDVGILNQHGEKQRGTTRPGSVGFQWRRVKLDVDADGGTNGAPSMQWSIDGREIGKLDAGADAPFTTNGCVTLGYSDPWESLSDNPTFLFGLIDNLRIVSGRCLLPRLIGGLTPRSGKKAAGE